MLRKLFIRTWFGPLPNWMDEYWKNVEPLKQYGFDWFLFTDYEEYQQRCREKLGVVVNIQPGTRKVADLDPALGLIFSDKIQGYDFWGHINLDCVFGRLDRFVSDKYLSGLDVFGGDPYAINGIFSMYRNTPVVNNLFKRVPGWGQIFASSELAGFDETPFSVVVREAHNAGEIVFRSNFWHGNDKMSHQKPPNIRLCDDGTLMCIPRDQEIAMYHFNVTRKWPIKDANKVPDLWNIAEFMPMLEDYASKSAFILEIGAGAGIGSMRAFSRGMRKSTAPDRLYVSVDCDHTCPQHGAPPDKFWHLIVDDSRERRTVEKVRRLAGDRKADVILIDSEHNYLQLQRELLIWKAFADNHTVWLFHDTYMEGKYNPMTDAVKEFAAKEGWKYEDVSANCNGMARLTKA